MVDFRKRHTFFGKGEQYIWLAASALTFFLLLILGLLSLVFINGLPAFWPSDLYEIQTNSGQVYVGEITAREHDMDKKSLQLKIGNRDLNGADFIWVNNAEIKTKQKANGYWMVERLEYGNFYGRLKPSIGEFHHGLRESSKTKHEIEQIQSRMSALNQKIRNGDLKAKSEKEGYASWNYNRSALLGEFDALQEELMRIDHEQKNFCAIFETADGKIKEIPYFEIVRAVQPNEMGVFQKLYYYGKRVVELILVDPRESNTEGGLFPAIFGTVILIVLMAISSFPFGVIAGIYLREYAKDGWLVRLVRIGVNNLAGIPSIVYGIFGLGFFVYTLGSSIDTMFFSETLPEPTFGTGGILWASLTLGILTIPVVIVATEEALGNVPSAVRDNSIALGATKFQTLRKVVLPMASPGILTGFILAMARAAGEVAPLMITGVVKLAPDLPLDQNFPFLHLDRKFMHLGFHIYDISMQSPNVEAAMPMIYVTTLLLILIVLALTSSAIYLRARMHKRYSMGSI